LNEDAMAKAKQKKRVVRAWTKADVKILRSIGKDPLSSKEAAQQLGRTRGAIYQKAMLLGIRFRSVKRKRRQAA
jgi:hypothetical protein